MKAQTKVIGHIGVDAGMCMVGDPCYVVDAPLGKMEWGEFLRQHCSEDDYPIWRIPNLRARDKTMALAIIVGSGYGDGVYPVTAEINEEGRVVRLTVDFA